MALVVGIAVHRHCNKLLRFFHKQTVFFFEEATGKATSPRLNRYDKIDRELYPLSSSLVNSRVGQRTGAGNVPGRNFLFANLSVQSMAAFSASVVAKSLPGNAIREPEILIFLDAFFPFRFDGVYSASESGNGELLAVFLVRRRPPPK